MLSLDRFRRFLTLLLQVIVAVLVAVLSILVVVAVICRKMEWTMEWYDEVASVMLAWLTYYGAALVALHRGHLCIPGVVKMLSRPWRIGSLILVEVVVISFFAVMAWQGTVVLYLLGDMRMISLPSVPIWFTQSVIPIGAFIFIAAELLSVKDVWPQPDEMISAQTCAEEEAAS